MWVQATSFPKLKRKQWVIVFLIVTLAAETFVFALVLLGMASKGTQSFPAFTPSTSIGPILRSVWE